MKFTSKGLFESMRNENEPNYKKFIEACSIIVKHEACLEDDIRIIEGVFEDDLDDMNIINNVFEIDANGKLVDDGFHFIDNVVECSEQSRIDDLLDLILY